MRKRQATEMRLDAKLLLSQEVGSALTLELESGLPREPNWDRGARLPVLLLEGSSVEFMGKKQYGRRSSRLLHRLVPRTRT